MLVVWQAEAYLALGQPEHRSELDQWFLFMWCSEECLPAGWLLPWTTSFVFGSNPNSMGRGSVRWETSFKGSQKSLRLCKQKEKPSHLEGPWKSHADLTESVQTCPLTTNAVPAAQRSHEERCRAARGRAECCRFLCRQLLFPPDNRGDENMQHYGSLFINHVPQ